MSRRDSLCARCHCGRSAPDDTWCTFCRAVEVLTSLAKRKGITPAYRALAEELVVQSGRQVEAIFELDKRSRGYTDSLTQRLVAAKAAKSPRDGTSEHLGATPKKESKPPLPRQTAQVVKTESGEVAGSSKSGEAPPSEPPEEFTAEDKKKDASPCRVPAEPAGPPPLRRQQEVRSRSRRRGRRAGQKHQQKFRVLEEPDRIFHSKLKTDKISLQEGRRIEHPWKRDGRSPRRSS